VNGVRAPERITGCEGVASHDLLFLGRVLAGGEKGGEGAADKEEGGNHVDGCCLRDTGLGVAEISSLGSPTALVD
jgi:hypothetical protein